MLISRRSANLFNASARTGSGHVAALAIDTPGSDGLYGVRALEFTGAVSSVDVLGFDVEILADGRRRFWMINIRPPIDPVSGEPVDAAKYGANGTVEVFELSENGRSLEYVKTVADEAAVVSPNSIAALGDGEILITNDHNGKSTFVLFIRL